MLKNNKREDYLGIYPTTQEYQFWMFTDDNTCQCRRCKKNRINQWPYERSLAGNLLYLTGINIDQINYNDVSKFEQTLIFDHLTNISQFWKYVTELCLLAGENGIEILRQFNNGLFDKRFIHYGRLHIPCPNSPHSKRNKKII
ncbi:unnamed protein product, partial [Rotaria socialis]